MASLSTEPRGAIRTSTWKNDTRGHVHDFPKEGEGGGGGEVHNEETCFFFNLKLLSLNIRRLGNLKKKASSVYMVQKAKSEYYISPRNAFDNR